MIDVKCFIITTPKCRFRQRKFGRSKRPSETLAWCVQNSQIREPVREVWQMAIMIVVREWGHLLINLPFIYLFNYSESTAYLIRDVWQNKIPWVFPDVVKMVKKFPEFSRFSLIFFSKKSLFPGFPWAVRTLNENFCHFMIFPEKFSSSFHIWSSKPPRGQIVTKTVDRLENIS